MPPETINGARPPVQGEMGMHLRLVRLAALPLFIVLAALGADAPLTVSGTALTPAGAPLAGVRAQLVPFPNSYGWGSLVLAGRAYPPPAVTVTADAAGRFSLRVPE